MNPKGRLEILLISLTVLSIWISPVRAQSFESDEVSKLEGRKGNGFHSEAIRWYLPGDFRNVLVKAKNVNRIILIRGLGFGLDELGAKCATKGCW